MAGRTGAVVSSNSGGGAGGGGLLRVRRPGDRGVQPEASQREAGDESDGGADGSQTPAWTPRSIGDDGGAAQV